jgi:hypothetical protein
MTTRGRKGTVEEIRELLREALDGLTHTSSSPTNKNVDPEDQLDEKLYQLKALTKAVILLKQGADDDRGDSIALAGLAYEVSRQAVNLRRRR